MQRWSEARTVDSMLAPAQANGTLESFTNAIQEGFDILMLPTEEELKEAMEEIFAGPEPAHADTLFRGAPAGPATRFSHDRN